jgi:hypothetical protein
LERVERYATCALDVLCHLLHPSVGAGLGAATSTGTANETDVVTADEASIDSDEEHDTNTCMNGQRKDTAVSLCVCVSQLLSFGSYEELDITHVEPTPREEPRCFCLCFA